MEIPARAALIPQVDKVLRHPRLVEAQSRFRREILAEICRQELGRCRAALESGRAVSSPDQIVDSILEKAEELLTPVLRPVINATGVILNTNLGRAPLPRPAIEQINRIAGGYVNLELDLRSGKRGRRDERVEELLVLITGAEAALVVNNNAAAVLLAINGLARDKEVIVSRGELIEIGGSFRLPEVIVAAGGTLKEVGTTNRTRLSDYRSALSERTAVVLKCHRSNFQITGFTEEASRQELVQLSRQSGIPLVEDLGSGMLADPQSVASVGEPSVSKSVESGCDLVSFSADKLLGGPQAGIIVGKKALVDKLRQNPLYRALRLDKLILSALEAVLATYLTPKVLATVPVLSMLSTPLSELRRRAERFATRANEKLSALKCTVVATQSATGGGSLPGTTLESCGIALHCRLTPNRLAELLRRGSPAVIAVVRSDEVVLDFRAIVEDDELLVLESLMNVDSACASPGRPCATEST